MRLAIIAIAVILGHMAYAALVLLIRAVFGNGD